MVHVKVPATTANLGPGFDVLGLALKIFDEYTFIEQESGFTYRLLGADAGEYGIDSNPDNLVYRAFATLFASINQPVPGIEITCLSHIPICRGLGSSAAATVAGLLGANAISRNHLSAQQVFELATQIEGHPDNVAPALFGGLAISLVDENGSIIHQRIPLADDLVCILAVPNFTLETQRARGVLPKHIPFKDAIFNVSRATLLVTALTRGDYSNLSELMEDRLHQPYRANLIPGFTEVKTAGLQAGAYGVAISGAGPTVLALASHEKATAIGEAMVRAFANAGVDAIWTETHVHNDPLLNFNT